ncbi:MAG: 30S ribosomal protein S17 [Phycisphaerae bacterium]|nr:30S ribosomal protein S17 [Phycisphaerae bacterium]
MTESSTSERRPQPKRTGLVTSDKGDKTIRVSYRYSMKHPKYGKYLRRRTTLHVHDEQNKAKVGNRVEVMACRPISKTKCWRLIRVLGV